MCPTPASTWQRSTLQVKPRRARHNLIWGLTILAEIPSSVSNARLLDTLSGGTIRLSTRPGSACHFAERFRHGDFEVGLRIDWSAIDVNGDPTLDADFFRPGETTPPKRPRFKERSPLDESAVHTHQGPPA